jgi:hypothetical protein
VLNVAGAQSRLARGPTERCFDEWVSRRLSGWSPTEIVGFERWLREQGEVEFLPAVREAGRRAVADAWLRDTPPDAA